MSLISDINLSQDNVAPLLRYGEMINYNFTRDAPVKNFENWSAFGKVRV